MAIGLDETLVSNPLSWENRKKRDGIEGLTLGDSISKKTIVERTRPSPARHRLISNDPFSARYVLPFSARRQSTDPRIVRALDGQRSKCLIFPSTISHSFASAGASFFSLSTGHSFDRSAFKDNHCR